MHLFAELCATATAHGKRAHATVIETSKYENLRLLCCGDRKEKKQQEEVSSWTPVLGQRLMGLH
jgi:hypothetical protein